MMYKKYISLVVAATLVFSGAPALALDGVCVSSPEACAAGGYSPPTTSGGDDWEETPYIDPGPSPAEIEARKRQDAVNAAINAGNAYYHQGNYEAAMYEYQRGLEIDQGNQALRNNLGYAIEMIASQDNDRAIVAYERGDFNEAIRLYKKALYNDPNRQIYLDNLRLAEDALVRRQEEQRLQEKATVDIRRDIDDLADSMASGGKGYLTSNPDDRYSLGVKVRQDNVPLEFLTDAQKSKPGTNKSAGDHLKAAAGVARRLGLMGGSAENEKEGAADIFDRGGKEDGHLEDTTVDRTAPADVIRKEVAELSPKGRLALERDPEYKRWQSESPKIEKMLSDNQNKQAVVREKMDKASGTTKARLQVDLVKLRDEESRVKNKKQGAESAVHEKIRTIKLHEEKME